MADVTSPFGFPYPEPTDLVRDGATDIEALAQAANDQFSAGFQFAGQRIYTSSGVFVKADPLGTGDIGLRAIRVRMVGGGAGGGGGAATGSGQVSVSTGGQGANFAESFITNIAGLAASVTVTRGSGGAGGTGTGGSAGGESSFDGLVKATGGRERLQTSTGSPPQRQREEPNRIGGSVGDIVIFGGISEGQQADGSAFTNMPVGGKGGDSAFGFGGAGGTLGTNGVAGGGGGALAQQATISTNGTGGAGGNGIVIVEVFV